MMNHTEAIYKAQIVFEDALTDKETIDELLKIDASLYTSLGIDSTKAEVASTKRASAFIYRLIKGIDPDKGDKMSDAQVAYLKQAYAAMPAYA